MGIALRPGNTETGGDHAVRSHTLLHPIHSGGQHVETVQGRASALTMTHAGHQVEASPRINRCRKRAIAGFLGHFLVIAECLQWPEPGVTVSVIKRQFSSVSCERREIGPSAVAETGYRVLRDRQRRPSRGFPWAELTRSISRCRTRTNSPTSACLAPGYQHPPDPPDFIVRTQSDLGAAAPEGVRQPSQEDWKLFWFSASIRDCLLNAP
jgi:hypothetical protein